MVAVYILCAILLPALVTCSGEGNLHLLEDEVAIAMKSCIIPTSNNKEGNSQRTQRSVQYGYQQELSPRIDGNTQDFNQYGHERRNTSDIRDQIHVLNATDYDYEGFGAGNGGEKLLNSVPRPAMTNRARRSDPLIAKPDADQCLSQCIFANLQVVDARGIPREAELWNKVQTAVTSAQSRAALRDQLRACFQEFQSEAEDDGCSYSKKLERCLMLRFSDRKITTQDKKS